MKVIKHDVEKTLLQAIQNSLKNNEAQRCLYLRTSTLDIDNQEWFAILVQALEELFDDKVDCIFRCHDDDVFILSRHITNKNLPTLFTHLYRRLMPVSFRKELASLFEIYFSWAELETICNDKINVLHLKKRQEEKLKEKKEKEAYRKELLNMEVRQELVDTISSRRNKRERSTILVVEDDLFSQRLVQNSIDKQHHVVMAKNGYEAITTYAQEAPDILFLDIGLPDINGHDILRKVFEMDRDAYVVMLSGNGDRKNVLKAIEQGAKGFIGKPFTKDKLFQYIEASPHIQEKRQKEYA